MLRVLIVDDSLIVRRNMQKFLTNLNIKVVGEAKNGVEAVEKCCTLKPNLITMDITMPDMDGITALKLIKEFDKDVKIIMSTSHGQEKMVLDSIKVGAKGYMLKPITEDKLVTTISKIFPLHNFKVEVYDEIEEIDERFLAKDVFIEDMEIVETIEQKENIS